MRAQEGKSRTLAEDATVDLRRFLELSEGEVATLVRASGRARVCGFPINGTRRWFALEHGPDGGGSDYLAALGRRSLELWRLFFDHGIESLVAPIFGPELLDRGEDYHELLVQMLEPGLAWFFRTPEVLEIYERYQIRVSVFGDTDTLFARLPQLRHLQEGLRKLCEDTSHHDRHRLLIGLYAHDSSTAIARIGVELFQALGRLPTRAEIVERYMGQPVGPLDLFIGFNHPTFFDMSLLNVGQEDLYFTICPSPYLDAITLRRILYDRLYARRISESYVGMSQESLAEMRAFYAANRHSVLGLGRASDDGTAWYPLPQVRLPNV